MVGIEPLIGLYEKAASKVSGILHEHGGVDGCIVFKSSRAAEIDAPAVLGGLKVDAAV